MHWQKILELAYFASGPALVVIALIGLRQLSIARKALDLSRREIEVRSRREAVVLAAEKAQACASSLLPELQANANLIGTTAKVKNWKLQDTDFTWASFDDPKGARAWADAVRSNEKAFLAALNSLNSLEGLAVYFVQGAADERVAYQMLGAVFCDAVEDFAPSLVALRQRPAEPGVASGPFENTIRLYRTWHLRAQQGDLEQQRARLHAEAAKGQTIPTIGTKVPE